MLNPPERKQRLSGERVAEISLAACSMPADVPATSWLNDLCADLFDARAVIAARDEQLALAHGAYDNLEMKYQAARLSVAQLDEEIARLRADLGAKLRTDGRDIGKDIAEWMQVGLGASVVKLRAALQRIAETQPSREEAARIADAALKEIASDR